VCESADGDGEGAQEDEARQRAQEGKKGAAETDKVLDKVLVKETVEKKPVKSDR
jgi:hypothetical protein